MKTTGNKLFKVRRASFGDWAVYDADTEEVYDYYPLIGKAERAAKYLNNEYNKPLTDESKTDD